MEKFLETYLPKLKYEEIENLNRWIENKEIESIIKNIPTKKISGPDIFAGEFYQTRRNTNPHQILPEIKEEGTLWNSF